MDEKKLRESFSYAVNKMMGELSERLHTVIDDLLVKLYNCFTERERQEINASKTNIKKVEEFFMALKTKDVDAYERCLIAMEDLNHHDLASTLKAEWKCAPQQSTEHPDGASLNSKVVVY